MNHDYETKEKSQKFDFSIPDILFSADIFVNLPPRRDIAFIILLLSVWLLHEIIRLKQV